MVFQKLTSLASLTFLSSIILLFTPSIVTQQIALDQHLPPFLAGVQDDTCFLSGFAQTVSFDIASNNLTPLIQDLEDACLVLPTDIPFNPRFFVDQEAGSYYYCAKNQSLLILDETQGFIPTGNHIALSQVPVFDEIKMKMFASHPNMIILLGLTNAPNTLDTSAKNYTQSEMVTINWQTRSVVQVLKLTGAHGEPIVDIEALPNNKIVVIGEKVYSCAEKMNTYYMGKWGDTSFNSVVDFYIATSYGFIPEIKATSDGKYLVYTNYDSIFVYDIKTTMITQSYDVTLVTNNYTVSGEVVLHWEQIPFTLTSEGQETYIFYQGNLTKYAIPDINDCLSESSITVQAPAVNSTYSRFFFFENGNEDRALVQMENSTYLFSLSESFGWILQI